MELSAGGGQGQSRPTSPAVFFQRYGKEETPSYVRHSWPKTLSDTVGLLCARLVVGQDRAPFEGFKFTLSRGPAPAIIPVAWTLSRVATRAPYLGGIESLRSVVAGLRVSPGPLTHAPILGGAQVVSGQRKETHKLKAPSSFRHNGAN